MTIFNSLGNLDNIDQDLEEVLHLREFLRKNKPKNKIEKQRFKSLTKYLLFQIKYLEFRDSMRKEESKKKNLNALI